jgi:membrane fusion protein (multidrug efflux system)
MRWSALLAFGLGCGEAAPTAPPSVGVVVAPVGQRDVNVTTEWIGTTEGAVDAEIRAQVTGNLISRDYEEGSYVDAGTLLFRIDPRPFRATLDEARGGLGRAQAQLAQTRLDVARYAPLVEEGAVSRQEYDNAVQAERAAAAAVQSAEAAVEKARLDVDFTEIRSPIDGIVGPALKQIGDLVGPGDARPVTTVSQVDPIRVSFPISEREYLVFAERIRQGTAQEPGRAVLQLVLSDGSVYPHPGTAFLAGRAVDPNTGTILVKGEFPNPGRFLRPGLYSRVQVVTDVLRGAIVVPQRAVQELQGTHQVAVVKDDHTVELRVVQPGPRDGSDQVILSGLQPGERIVVEGLQKVRNGTVVEPQPAPAAEAS